MFCLLYLVVNAVTVADYISRAESQSRQMTTKDTKKNKEVVSTLNATFSFVSSNDPNDFLSFSMNWPDTVYPSLCLYLFPPVCAGSYGDHRWAQPTVRSGNHQRLQQRGFWWGRQRRHTDSWIFHREVPQSLLLQDGLQPATRRERTLLVKSERRKWFQIFDHLWRHLIEPARVHVEPWHVNHLNTSTVLIFYLTNIWNPFCSARFRALDRNLPFTCFICATIHFLTVFSQ